MMTIPIIKTVLVAVTITITITAVPVAPLDSFLSLEANDVVGRHSHIQNLVQLERNSNSHNSINTKN